jgi:hypothetical protein
LRVSIAGRILEITPGDTTATVTDLTIGGDPNPSTPLQVWMWQAEKWTITNDGSSKPIFTDETTNSSGVATALCYTGDYYFFTATVTIGCQKYQGVTYGVPYGFVEYIDIYLYPPEENPNDIRLRHTAIGLNFIDIYHRQGLYPLPMPIVLGTEGAGVIEAVGEGVTGWRGVVR